MATRTAKRARAGVRLGVRAARPKPDALAFLSLDFLYVPSQRPDREFAYYTRVLGGVPLFRIKAMDTEVAGVRLSRSGPIVLLAEHLRGASPVLVYRVESLRSTSARLKRRGWRPEQRFEIPHGPCATFTAEGGQRLAIYELRRPTASRHIMGRFDE